MIEPLDPTGETGIDYDSALLARKKGISKKIINISQACLTGKELVKGSRAFTLFLQLTHALNLGFELRGHAWCDLGDQMCHRQT